MKVTTGKILTLSGKEVLLDKEAARMQIVDFNNREGLVAVYLWGEDINSLKEFLNEHS